MGAASNPIGSTSQKLEKGVSTTSDALGTATFTFPTPPGGMSWTGTLNCAGAPVGSVFTVTVGATSWGSWGGNSVFGPVQIFGTGAEQLVVEATGLAASTTYEIWFLGSSDNTNNTAPIWPDATSSALQAQIQGGASLIVQQSGAAIGTSYTVLYNQALSNTATSLGVFLGSDVTNHIVSVTCTNATTGQSYTVQTQNVPLLSGGQDNTMTAGNNNFYFPVTVAAGQTLLVTARSRTAIAGTVFGVIGYNQMNSVFVVNPPNTTLATWYGGGTQYAQVVSPSNTGVASQILAAPQTGFSYRLWTLGYNPQGAFTGTIGLSNAAGYLAQMDVPSVSGTGAGTQGSSMSLHGQIASNAVNVQTFTNFTVGVVYVRFDIVPNPQYGTAYPPPGV